MGFSLGFANATALGRFSHQRVTGYPLLHRVPKPFIATSFMMSLPSPSRREFLLQTPFLTLGASLTGSMHSELSELASKIPGAGMPDVYYPDFFEGEWYVSRDLYAVETPAEGKTEALTHATLGKQAIIDARDRVGLRQTFKAKFVRHRGHVIEDRFANEKAETESNFPLQLVNVTWDRSNPNVLSVSHFALPAGANIIREVKVTKRSFIDGPQGFGTFVASEYARLVDVEGEGSRVGFGKPPSIYARRRIVRYRVNSVSKELEPDGMDRLVVDYLYPPSPPDAKAAVVLKYRDFLSRKGQRSETT